MFSKTCKYGIRATLYIAQKSQKGERAGLTEIAEAINSPKAFTAKILQRLAKAEIVSSIKGPNGGFYIEEAFLHTTTVKQIVTAIDGDALFVGCALGLKQCNEDAPCPLHNAFVKIRTDVIHLLENASLLDVAYDLNEGLTVLKR